MNLGAHTARDTALLQVAVSHHTDVEEVGSSLPPGLVAALVVPAVAPSLGRAMVYSCHDVEHPGFNNDQNKISILKYLILKRQSKFSICCYIQHHE